MAVITQSKQYNCFIRKIGYSVGLEKLLERVSALVDLYARDQQISFVEWVRLIEEVFGRKEKAKSEPTVKRTTTKNKKPYDHFGDFYQSLNLIRLMRKKIIPLYGLETLAILKQKFQEEEQKYLESLKIVLLYLVLENDGDIFLNCLAGNFEEKRTKDLIRSMIEIKREVIKQLIKNPSLLEVIFHIVDIQDFSSLNKNDASSPYKRRNSPLSGSPKVDVEISSTQLRHIITPRKGWANDFGLFDNGPTILGIKLINEFRFLGMQDPEKESIQFWPYESELKNLRLNPEHLGIPKLNSWAILIAISKAFDIAESHSNILSDNDYELLKSIYMAYRNNDPLRGTIRNQLPLYIAFPCFVAAKIAQNECIPNLPDLIQHEIGQKKRRLERSNIRGTEGGLIFRDLKK